MVTVELVCPLCGTEVAGGLEPAPGRCPGCGAHYAGGGASAPEGVAMALSHWDLDDLPADLAARRLFDVEPHPAPTPTAAITSDRREGFYLWWVFVRPADTGVAPVLRELLSGS